jgi:hypothetical protein
MHPKRGGNYKKYRVARVKVLGREAYDLVFYNTPVIRYFEPNPDSSRHVSVRYYDSNSTREFMFRHSWAGGSKRFYTNESTEVYVPFCHSKGPAFPSAFLTFDSTYTLVLDRSWHAPLCKYFSSDADKQSRKDFKRVLSTVFDLLYVQEQEIRHTAISNTNRYGWQWSSHRSNAIDDLNKYIGALIYNPEAEAMLSPNTIEFLMRETAVALRQSADRAAYKEAKEVYPHSGRWAERTKHRDERTPVLIQTMDMKIPITAVRDEMLQRCGFMGKNERVELPQFLTEPPKGRFFHFKDGHHYPEEMLLNMYKKD